MQRRRVLEVLGCSLFATIAGCMSGRNDGGQSSPGPSATPTPETETPVGTPDPGETPSSTSGPPRTSTRSHRSAFVSYVEERGVTVDRIEVDGSDRTVELRYVTTETTYQKLSAEIGMIAGRFFFEVDHGWGMKRLNATVLRGGRSVATWYAKTEWLQQFKNGEITADELSLRVLKTVSPINESS